MGEGACNPDAGLKGWRSSYRRPSRSSSLRPFRQLEDANEKLRSSFMRRVKTVGGRVSVRRTRSRSGRGCLLQSKPLSSWSFNLGRQAAAKGSNEASTWDPAAAKTATVAAAAAAVLGGVAQTGARSLTTKKTNLLVPYETKHIIRPHGNRKKREITFENVRKVCNLPINEAANQLDIGVTVLKKYCRKFDIPRWPYRILSSLKKLILSMEDTQQQSSSLKDEIRQLQDLKLLIETDPRRAQEIPDW